MNIRARINARKVVLSFMYQHCFFRFLLKQSHSLADALFIDNIFQTQKEVFKKEKEDFVGKIETYLKENYQDSIDEYIELFFDERDKNDIDYDYMSQVLTNLTKYEQEMEKKVSSYTNTFSYDEMDVMDQSLFLLGYVERKVLQTPKEVIINELIELAKRYSDDGAPKLLNGVMHKILNESPETPA